MINWYLPLYLGVILILFLFPHIGSFPSLKVYSEGRSGFGGLSMGTNLLLSRLISGDLLAFAIISVLLFGFIGGIGFALMILTSLLLYLLTVYKLHQHKQNQSGAHSIIDLLRERTNKLSYKYYLLVLFGVNLGNMLLQLAALNYLLGSYFIQSRGLIVFLVVIFSVIYAGLGGFEALNKGAKPQMLIVFFTTALITFSVFMDKGLFSTYLDFIKLPVRSLNFIESTLFFFTGVIFLFTQHLLDHSLWHCVYQLKPKRQYSILVITVFCVIAISLGLSAMTIYGMSQDTLSVNNLLRVLETYNSTILLNLYIVTIFIAVVSSYAFNLYSTVLLYFKLTENEHSLLEKNQIKKGYLFALFMSTLTGTLFLLMPNLTLINIILILGVFYASMAIPYLNTLFRSTPSSRFIPYIGLIPLTIGMITYVHFEMTYTPLLCLTLGIILQSLVKLISKIPNKL